MSSVSKEVSKIRKSKAALKGRLTRAENFLNQPTYSKNELIVRLESIQSVLSDFTSLQRELDDIIEDVDEENVEEDGELDEFESKFYKVQASYKDKIEWLSNEDERMTQSSSNPAAPIQMNSISTALPRIEIPKFSGNVSNWHSFKDLFTSLIHNDPNMDRVRKFYYLKNSLEGEALNAIKSISVTSENYQGAWDILLDRYNNKKVIVNFHFRKLFNMPQIKSEDSAEIRNIIDVAKHHINALEALNLPTKHWGDILVFLISSKLDSKTKRAWDISLKTDDLPTFPELEKFLEQEAYARSNESSTQVTRNFVKREKTVTCATQVVKPKTCNICKEGHKTHLCPKLTTITPHERFILVKDKNLCLKCFRPEHSAAKCTFYNCHKCQGQHNTLLHFESRKPIDFSTTSSPIVSHSSCISQVLLATASIQIKDRDGNPVICRGLLDSGSQSNFITRNLAEKLKLKIRKTDSQIRGITGTKTKILFLVKIEISSPISDFKKTIDCFVIPRITGELPSQAINIREWNFLKTINLSDSTFFKPGRVDLLVGADTFEEISLNQTFRPGDSYPILRNTQFGWVLSGRIEGAHQNPEQFVTCTASVELSRELQRFWELEECSSTVITNDDICESHFRNTFKRLKDGRFEVSMIFNKDLEKCPLGDSVEIAKTRFLQQEKRFSRNPQLYLDYSAFIEEYLELGHMEEIKSECEIKTSREVFYLPHHSVIKDDSTTTKLRVVFNGSQKSTSGLSLNDKLLCGPTIQDDIFSILARFRFHKYAFSADIAKMYRQISIEPEQRDLLRIVWRFKDDDILRHYRLTTVTYGTKIAPFLATRCIKQLSLENSTVYPIAAKTLMRDCYVDNILSGGQSIEESLELQDDLIKITNSGQFLLRKWVSNDTRIINNVDKCLREESVDFNRDFDETVTTLGLSWSPIKDSFVFKFRFSTEVPTKRLILSQISRIFDPLGLLSPLVVRAKIIIQLLWLRKIDWDVPLDLELESKWKVLCTEFNQTKELVVPRFIVSDRFSKEVVIHGFCDASKAAYAACIYVVSFDGVTKKTHSRLLCSKTRVSPLKTQTIARLELCGAQLLASLVDKVCATLYHVSLRHLYLWCDSQIVIHWLNSPASKWKVFVANRVSHIHELLKDKPHSWKYVSTKCNPADLASRGISLHQLQNNSLWWSGPDWLLSDPERWPKSNVNVVTESDIECSSFAVVCGTDYFIDKFSSLSTLLNVTVYILKFFTICSKGNPSEFFTGEDYQHALMRLIRFHQSHHFANEISTLKKNQNVTSTSRILTLCPFLDKNGILRIGGRLKNAPLTFDQRHPIILKNNDNLTRLIIRYEHRLRYHAGSQLLRSILFNKYWILKGISTIKQEVRKCMICARLRKERIVQLMGNLPVSRVTMSRPFDTCGIDYAGPFLIKRYRGRCNKIEKSYVCIFVCFSTRAIHIELVSDLSTDAFIASLRRFVARRGCPSKIYSDNGKNFVGAKSLFDEIRTLHTSQAFKEKVSQWSAEKYINWTTIPAYSPHMGGLWEAGVKSIKTHLRPVFEQASFTFEEFYTVLCEIEMCLNSRPLTALTTDPNDLQALTPAHFLITTAVLTLPEKELPKKSCNCLKLWDQIQRCRDMFWKRWQKEFLSRLQTRTKWKQLKSNLKIGELVLVSDNALSPLKWPLARVVMLHPGKDNLVRVVDLKTEKGIITRSLANICRLPCNSDPSDHPGEHV